MKKANGRNDNVIIFGQLRVAKIENKKMDKGEIQLILGPMFGGESASCPL